jgi:hypothetical protein
MLRNEIRSVSVDIFVSAVSQSVQLIQPESLCQV